MKKSIKVGVFVCFFLMWLGVTSFAHVKATTVVPLLSFNSNTANCSVTVTEIGKNIDITLALKYGNTVVDSWTKTGKSTVTISESTAVVSGRTYTLEASGTINGSAINSIPVTATCP